MSKKIIALFTVITVLVTMLCPVFAADEDVTASITSKITREVFSVNDPEVSDKNSFVLDLGDTYEIDKIDVTQYNSNVSGMKSMNVYFSTDGKNYMMYKTAYNTNTVEIGDSVVSCDIDSVLYASHIKIYAELADKKSGIDVKTVKVYGKDGKEQEEISKNATYYYYTQQPYQTDTDARLADSDNNKLLDGDTDEMVGTECKWMTFVVDLKKPYQIGDVEIYSNSEGTSFMEGCEIRYSLDNSKYLSYPYYVNDNERNAGGVVKSTFSGIPGKNARYLKFICQSTTGKMEISEIKVNGYDIEVEKEEGEGLTQVPFNIQMKNFLLAYVDWSSFNSQGVSQVNLYIEKNYFDNVDGMVPKLSIANTDERFVNKYAQYYSLEPEATYFFAMTPVDENGNELKAVKPLRIDTEKVVSGKVSNTFNITNHPSYGGGATVGYGSYTQTMKEEAVRLYDELGCSNKNSHWTTSNNDMYQKIGVCVIANNDTCDHSLGCWMTNSGNEPDLSRSDVVAYSARIKAAHAKLQAEDPRNVLADPRLGGTWTTSTNWLDQLYAAGGGREFRQCFDVLDAHCYCKSEDEQIPGLPTACPEQLYTKLARLRTVMAKYDDEDKPIICTEAGWQTGNVPQFQAIITYDEQRNYLVRYYLIGISQGLKESWWYNFHDDGLNVMNGEHNWGLVNYFGTPKPSYYGMYNMYEQLRDCDLVGPVSGVSHPYYGVDFFDRMKDKYISTLWAADGQQKVLMFETKSGKDEKIEVIGTDGSFRTIQTENGGKGSIDISGAPVFLYSESGIQATTIDAAFAITERDKTTIVNKEVTFEIERKALGEGITGYVSPVDMPNGFEVVGDTHFTADQQTIPVTIRVTNDALEQLHKFSLNVISDDLVAYPLAVSVNILYPLDIKVYPTPVTPGKWDEWNLNFECTNIVDANIDAMINITGSSGITIKDMETKNITNLVPGDKQTVSFLSDSPSPLTSTSISYRVNIGGKMHDVDRKMAFVTCMNDGIKPVIDGIKSPGEYDNCQPIYPDSSRPSNWGGNSDAFVTMYSKWDDDNVYFYMDVEDDVQRQLYSGNEVWNGDSIQFTLDLGRKEGVAGSATEYYELGLSLNGKNEPQTWCWKALLPTKVEMPIVAASTAGRRTNDGHTIYEISIPWAYLATEPTTKEHDAYGFAWALNDDDGTGRKIPLKFMDGITNSKNPEQFADLVLIKK